MRRSLVCLGLVAACHHASRDAAPAPADAGHATPSEYTVTYTTQELGAAAGPLVTTIVSSTGQVTRMVDRPPQRFIGTVDAGDLAALARLVADPALPDATQSQLNG